MKKYRKLILIPLSILLFLFQIAVWIAAPHPENIDNVLEVFWYLLQIVVPIGLGGICLLFGLDD